MNIISKYLLLFLIAIISKTTFAQKGSDYSYLSTSELPDDTAKITALVHNFDLSTKNKDFVKADAYFDEILSLIERLNHPTSLEKILDNSVGNLIQNGNFDKCLAYTLLIKNSVNKLKYVPMYTVIENHLGTLYWHLGNDSMAIVSYERSLAVDINKSSPIAKAGDYNNLGMVYRKVGKYDKAYDYYYQALLIFLSENNKLGLGNCYNNIGVLYQIQNKFENAYEFYQKSLEVREEIQDSIGMAITLGNIGENFINLNRNDSAEKYLLRSFYLSEKLKDLEGVYGTALTLNTLYEKINNYKEALHFYKIYVKAFKEFENEESKREMVKKEAELKFEQEFQKREILAEAEKRKQNIYTGAGLTVLLIVSVFSVILYKRFRFTQKQNSIIETQKHIVENKNKEIVDSINYAKRLQDAILPPLISFKDLLPQSFVLYQPKDIVAGDFYWLESVNDTVFVAAADCTGHGVPGAIVSVVCSNALKRAVKEFRITEPGPILDKVRELVIETFEKSASEVKDGMDISLATITRTGNNEKVILKWAGANNPLWFIKNNIFEEIKANKQPIGITDKPAPFTTHTRELNNGDSFYLFTDGYADQFGGVKGKKFKYDQLKKVIIENIDKPMTDQQETLTKIFQEWKGNLVQVDDILIIGIKF